MKEIKQTPNSFLKRLVSLLVAELFLCSSLLPAWASPDDFLRPRPAKTTFVEELEEAADGGAKDIQTLRGELVRQFKQGTLDLKGQPFAGLELLRKAASGRLHEFIGFYMEKASRDEEDSYRHFEEILEAFKEKRGIPEEWLPTLDEKETILLALFLGAVQNPHALTYWENPFFGLSPGEERTLLGIRYRVAKDPDGGWVFYAIGTPAAPTLFLTQGRVLFDWIMGAELKLRYLNARRKGDKDPAHVGEFLYWLPERPAREFSRRGFNVVLGNHVDLSQWLRTSLYDFKTLEETYWRRRFESLQRGSLPGLNQPILLAGHSAGARLNLFGYANWILNHPNEDPGVVGIVGINALFSLTPGARRYFQSPLQRPAWKMIDLTVRRLLTSVPHRGTKISYEELIAGRDDPGLRKMYERVRRAYRLRQGAFPPLISIATKTAQGTTYHHRLSPWKKPLFDFINGRFATPGTDGVVDFDLALGRDLENRALLPDKIISISVDELDHFAFLKSQWLRDRVVVLLQRMGEGIDFSRQGLLASYSPEKPLEIQAGGQIDLRLEARDGGRRRRDAYTKKFFVKEKGRRLNLLALLLGERMTPERAKKLIGQLEPREFPSVSLTQRVYTLAEAAEAARKMRHPDLAYRRIKTLIHKGWIKAEVEKDRYGKPTRYKIPSAELEKALRHMDAKKVSKLLRVDYGTFLKLLNEDKAFREELKAQQIEDLWMIPLDLVQETQRQEAFLVNVAQAAKAFRKTFGMNRHTFSGYAHDISRLLGLARAGEVFEGRTDLTQETILTRRRLTHGKGISLWDLYHLAQEIRRLERIAKRWPTIEKIARASKYSVNRVHILSVRKKIESVNLQRFGKGGQLGRRYPPWELRRLDRFREKVYADPDIGLIPTGILVSYHRGRWDLQKLMEVLQKTDYPKRQELFDQLRQFKDRRLISLVLNELLRRASNAPNGDKPRLGLQVFQEDKESLVLYDLLAEIGGKELILEIKKRLTEELKIYGELPVIASLLAEIDRGQSLAILTQFRAQFPRFPDPVEASVQVAEQRLQNRLEKSVIRLEEVNWSQALRFGELRSEADRVRVLKQFESQIFDTDPLIRRIEQNLALRYRARVRVLLGWPIRVSHLEDDQYILHLPVSYAGRDQTIAVALPLGVPSKTVRAEARDGGERPIGVQLYTLKSLQGEQIPAERKLFVPESTAVVVEDPRVQKIDTHWCYQCVVLVVKQGPKSAFAHLYTTNKVAPFLQELERIGFSIANSDIGLFGGNIEEGPSYYRQILSALRKYKGREWLPVHFRLQGVDHTILSFYPNNSRGRVHVSHYDKVGRPLASRILHLSADNARDGGTRPLPKPTRFVILPALSP